MALSWNEIKDRALKFSKEWAYTANEEADAKDLENQIDQLVFQLYDLTEDEIKIVEGK